MAHTTTNVATDTTANARRYRTWRLVVCGVGGPERRVISATTTIALAAATRYTTPLSFDVAVNPSAMPSARLILRVGFPSHATNASMASANVASTGVSVVAM